MDMKSISQKLQDDIRAIMEAGLHPNQQKIDVHEPEKDKITAHDFKKLRAMKKTKTEEHALESAEQVEEEEKKKIVSPFDYKNYKSQIPKKPGELTGHDSKKTSTGTVYTKRPVKENTDIGEARKLEGTYSHSNGNQSKVYKLSGEHDEGDPYHVKLFKGGKHYEPADYFTNDKEDAHGTAKHMVKEESHQSKTTIQEQRKDKPLTLFKKDKRTYHPPKEESHQAATTMKHIPNASPALKKAAKDIKPGIAGYRDRIAMLKAGGVKEEVEELDELSKTTLGSYAKKATRDAVITRKIGADFEHQGKRAKSPGMKAASDELSQKYKSKSWQRRDGVDKAVDRLTKEEVELDEAKSLHKMSAGELDQAHKDNEAKIAAIHKNDPTVRITKSHPLISKRRSINLHKVIRSKQSNEEVELDEGSGPKEKQKTPFRNINGPEYKAAADKQRQQMAKDKAAEPGKKMMAKPMKEDSVPNEYTFADYLEAARAQYVDEDAVLVANEAFKNKDITLFSDQSQSSEA